MQRIWTRTAKDRLDNDSMDRGLIGIGLSFAVLLIQNLAIYWGHYFEDVGFRWDFPQGYYGVAALWLAAVQRGINIQWIPFQEMGYPLALQLQSGFYYPPFWAFPLLHVPYTLHAAVVFQILHVLFGAVGMFFFLRETQKSAAFALIGAFIFQFFGGFYSNSEHPDIIRAFALTPWLLYMVTFNLSSAARLPRRVLLTPLFVYLLATGGYPGNLISGMLIAGAYVAAQLGDGLRKGIAPRQLLVTGGSLAGLTLLGITMAAISLGPSWTNRNLMDRYGRFESLVPFGLWIEHLPALFLTNKTVPGEISMTSSYVTLPALILASFVPLARLKQYWTQTLIGVLGLLMVPGTKSIFWVAMTTLLPPLRFSRFPSSDYRLFLAIPLIFFALLGLRAILEKELTWRSVLTRTVFVVLWLSAGVYFGYAGQWNEAVLQVILIAGATSLLMLFLWKSRSGLTGLVAASVILVVALDGVRVLPDMNTWQEPEISSWYYKNGWPYEKDGVPLTYYIFSNLPKTRPARLEVPKYQFDWGGYIDGRFMLEENGGAIGLLQADRIVQSNASYKQYMLRQWTPVLLDPAATGGSTSEIALPGFDPLASLANTAANPAGGIQQTFYGLNDIVYTVSLKQPRLLVENEIYFPGWTAELTSPGQEQQVQALDVNGAFRAWLLPAGNYQMMAHFVLPNLLIYQAVSFASLGLWLLVVAIYGVSRLRRSLPLGSRKELAGS